MVCTVCFYALAPLYGIVIRGKFIIHLKVYFSKKVFRKYLDMH